jgi:hypothetical protein
MGVLLDPLAAQLGAVQAQSQALTASHVPALEAALHAAGASVLCNHEDNDAEDHKAGEEVDKPQTLQASARFRFRF